ncbi:MAG: fumarylacetoacetate hydrolase family protein [Candidatus Nanopelagicales bacterium]
MRAVAVAIEVARRDGRTLPAPALGRPLTLPEAYAVQRLRTSERTGRGERVVGWKLGYTSAAMRAQMGIDSPNHGPLTDAMLRDSGACVPDSAVQPRVEPEVALVLGRDLPGPATPEQAAAAVLRARAALEVVDSVWQDYRFTLEDNTADGSSAAYVVLGGELSTEGLDRVEAVLTRNGEEAGSGRGSDVMGHPLAALAWLAGALAEQGVVLRAGDVVITGGLTAAVPLEPGDGVRARIGSATVTVRRDPVAHRSITDPVPEEETT